MLLFTFKVYTRSYLELNHRITWRESPHLPCSDLGPRVCVLFDLEPLGQISTVSPCRSSVLTARLPWWLFPVSSSTWIILTISNFLIFVFSYLVFISSLICYPTPLNSMFLRHLKTIFRITSSVASLCEIT